MTDLLRPVKRRTNEYQREAGRLRRIVVTLYPAGFLGLRLERCRREETLPLQAAYTHAVKARVAQERAVRRMR